MNWQKKDVYDSESLSSLKNDKKKSKNVNLGQYHVNIPSNDSQIGGLYTTGLNKNDLVSELSWLLIGGQQAVSYSIWGNILLVCSPWCDLLEDKELQQHIKLVFLQHRGAQEVQRVVYESEDQRFYLRLL